LHLVIRFSSWHVWVAVLLLPAAPIAFFVARNRIHAEAALSLALAHIIGAGALVRALEWFGAHRFAIVSRWALVVFAELALALLLMVLPGRLLLSRTETFGSKERAFGTRASFEEDLERAKDRECVQLDAGDASDAGDAGICSSEFPRPPGILAAEIPSA